MGVIRQAVEEKDSKSRRLFSWLVSRDNGSSEMDSAVTPTSEFEEQLNRERARADRAGSEFVVLIFRVEFNGARDPLLPHTRRILAETVSGELRLCDTTGWFSNGEASLAAILPDTSKHESYTPMRRAEREFTKRFKGAFPSVQHLPQLVCEIHTYPGEGSWGRGPSAPNGPGVELRKEVFRESEARPKLVNENGSND